MKIAALASAKREYFRTAIIGTIHWFFVVKVRRLRAFFCDDGAAFGDVSAIGPQFRIMFFSDKQTTNSA